MRNTESRTYLWKSRVCKQERDQRPRKSKQGYKPEIRIPWRESEVWFRGKKCKRESDHGNRERMFQVHVHLAQRLTLSFLRSIWAGTSGKVFLSVYTLSLFFWVSRFSYSVPDLSNFSKVHPHLLDHPPTKSYILIVSGIPIMLTVAEFLFLSMLILSWIYFIGLTAYKTPSVRNTSEFKIQYYKIYWHWLLLLFNLFPLVLAASECPSPCVQITAMHPHLVILSISSTANPIYT